MHRPTIVCGAKIGNLRLQAIHVMVPTSIATGITNGQLLEDHLRILAHKTIEVGVVRHAEQGRN